MSTHPQNCIPLVDILTNMSEQFGEMCRDLQTNSHPGQTLYTGRDSNNSIMINKSSSIFHQVGDGEEDHQLYGQTLSTGRDSNNNIMVNKSSSIIQQEGDGEENHQLYEEEEEEEEGVFSSQVEHLRIALEATQACLKEEQSAKMLLKEQLDVGANHLAQVIEDHAKELQCVIHVHSKVNIELANDISRAELSLVELGTRYKTLVANLEDQLGEARNEVTELQKNMSLSKVDGDKNESLISNLERIGKKNKMQIQGLRSHLDGEDEAQQVEKLQLLETIEELTKEANEQQSRVLELATINEDLIELTKSKEDEIRRLKKKLKKLKQLVVEKTDETKKLSEEVDEANKKVDYYSKICEISQSKLEQCEQEFSSYIIQEMNGENK